MTIEQPLRTMVRKLRTRTAITAEGEAAILALRYVLRTYEPPAYLIREGTTLLTHCSFIVRGFAYRQKLTFEGARQIVAVQIPGDFLDLQHLFLNYADHNIQALTQITTIDIERSMLQELALRHPDVGRALWIDALVDASIAREWITNVGRRDARGRIAHLLCEFAIRMRAAGLSDGLSCELPMTQEQIGDAVGLTNVHVNRVMKSLVAEGVVQRDKRTVSFTDWIESAPSAISVHCICISIRRCRRRPASARPARFPRLLGPRYPEHALHRHPPCENGPAPRRCPHRRSPSDAHPGLFFDSIRDPCSDPSSTPRRAPRAGSNSAPPRPALSLRLSGS